MKYLNFKKTNCKNCYKCLRECPVKSITVLDHQARISEEDCILCGRCIDVCHQNAKEVKSGLDVAKTLIKLGRKTIVSIAPSFISSFDTSFEGIEVALKKLGFCEVRETADGAKIVVEKYADILRDKKPKNLIASACPSIVKLIQMYYPLALDSLAMVDSPMVAHAKMILEEYPDADVVFVGPCISKKREADESKIISAVITFEELEQWLKEENVVIPSDCKPTYLTLNKARHFPISRGIIKSFPNLEADYEYIAIDGVDRAKEVLSTVENLKGMFFEINACDFGCINGPCSIKHSGGYIKATEQLRKYAKPSLQDTELANSHLDIINFYPRIKLSAKVPTDSEIDTILAKIGKSNNKNILNCGACGYQTCREKAIAVYNGNAEIEMCVPYMRERAETMSYEIIKNSPNGIIAIDTDLKIVDINSSAKELLNIHDNDVKGRYLVDYYNPTDFLLVMQNKRNIIRQKIHIPQTDKTAEISISYLEDQKLMFGILLDVTRDDQYQAIINKVKQDTIDTANRVVEKQMRVAQEIASLLGETTAETKVALVKLKNTLLNG